MEKFTAEEIIQYISNAEKETPLKIYINGNLKVSNSMSHCRSIRDRGFKLCSADARDWQKFYPSIEDKVTDIVIEQDRRNSAIPLMDFNEYESAYRTGCIHS